MANQFVLRSRSSSAVDSNYDIRDLKHDLQRAWIAASEYALRAFLRLVPEERHRLFALTMIVGGVCGVAAVSFHSAIRTIERLLTEQSRGAVGNNWVVWMVLTPALGALCSGILLQFVFPSARGSGIPQVKVVYAARAGRVRLRDAVGKFLVATLQIGSGSALGREGPTVQICAGVSSALGRLFALSPGNLRRMLAVGAAAGIAAAFNAPIAAVTFVIEEIVGDLDQTLLSGVVVAAALAAVIERSVLGEHPVFHVPGEYRLQHASSLLMYAGLGAAAALLSELFYATLLRLRGWFGARNAVYPWAHPAVGGFVTGALALAALLALNVDGVTGDGYGTLSVALSGKLALHVMLALMAAKFIATVCCYSSGGAGGIFAPVLFIGGMLGGSFGHIDQLLLSHAGDEVGAFALVGMGAFFSAVVRAPITSVLIIFEMTRGYGLVLPLMIANMSAYALARRRRPVPIYEALLQQDGVHLPSDRRAATVLSGFRVANAMTSEVVTLPADLTVAEAIEQVANLPYSMFPVVDGGNVLIGVVTEAKLRRKVAEGLGSDPVRSHARVERYLDADLSLGEAVVIMNGLGARQMAVTSALNSGRLAGVLAMSDVMRAHALAAVEPGSPDRPTSLRPVVFPRRRDTHMN